MCFENGIDIVIIDLTINIRESKHGNEMGDWKILNCFRQSNNNERRANDQQEPL